MKSYQEFMTSREYRVFGCGGMSCNMEVVDGKLYLKWYNVWFEHPDIAYDVQEFGPVNEKSFVIASDCAIRYREELIRQLKESR